MERRSAKRPRRENHGELLQEPILEEREDGRKAWSPADLYGPSAMNRSNPGQNALSRSDREDPSLYHPRTTTSIDWRHEICHSLELNPNSSDRDIFLGLQGAFAKLKDAERVRQTQETNQGHPRYQIIHLVVCQSSQERSSYLEQPWIVRAGPRRLHLRGGEQMTNMELYLERNKDVSFFVLREYTCCRAKSRPIDQQRLDGDVETLLMSMLMTEHIDIVSHALRSQLARLSDIALKGIPHPKFGRDRNEEQDMTNDSDDESISSYSHYNDYSDRKDLKVSYPYLWFYHRRQGILEATHRLEEIHEEHFNIFCGYIQNRMSEEWASVDKLIGKSQITAEYIQYIYTPGEIVLSAPKGSATTKIQASLVTNWLELDTQDPDHFSPSILTASWSFDGKFQKDESSFKIGDLPSLSHPFNIRELNPHPIQFSDDNHIIVERLRERGKMFWRCRARNYVCFKSFVDDGSKIGTDSRFMIDLETLQQMHPMEHRATNRDDLGIKVLSRDSPPLQDDFIMCFPPTISAFNMQKKEWVSLDVDLIEGVSWNTDAFKFLVVEDRMKELVEAVVTNQIHAAETTDLIHGKGSGLTMLLHGGPGTGKTLTAESVAEVAKKPLYRVTCGDIGTKAEEVEKYLETIFLLGKTWDCVVLLDEADVFLEERSSINLGRNALVSVFLRMLEYYDGILILTSNRVGIFDEAFKSRIQLTLHYQNLDAKQRLEIWKNFISRLKHLADYTNGFEIDAEDILSHIDELSKPRLNGREIRNSIATARQLARYRGQALGYTHLEAVIAEAEKFDQYLRDLHEGFTADERRKDKGER